MKGSATIFVSGFPSNFSTSETKKFFQEYGGVLDVRVPTGEGRQRVQHLHGVWFVTYDTRKAAEQAIVDLQGGYCLGKKEDNEGSLLRVKMAYLNALTRCPQRPFRISSPLRLPELDEERQWESENSREHAHEFFRERIRYSVHLGNLPPDVPEETVREKMETFGTLKEGRAVFVHWPREGQRSSYAFVHYKDIEGYRNAIQASHIYIDRRRVTIGASAETNAQIHGNRGGSRRGGTSMQYRGESSQSRGGRSTS